MGSHAWGFNGSVGPSRVYGVQDFQSENVGG